ncbi:proline-rich receptor-like protein kinase PERK3 [Andrographis paniculata]|uniref:proline-rich receptor-like protein kinase PERK3 n=1 Tax=Andrographis paniculata TaxID=175694 RepID=UPI0021E8F4DC|nr:proline-rich receptor-like protein kinase PERK3 [Andrographis paniculata]
MNITKMNPSNTTQVPSFLTLFFAIFFVVVAAQSLSENCIGSSWNDPSRGDGNWGGFLKNTTCASPFERYLYALARKANQTEEIFPSSREQEECLSRIEDGFGCGIERLSNGQDGCSNYTVRDVEDKLGGELRELDKSCKNLGPDSECGECVTAWEKIWRSGNEGNKLCTFAVLVLLMSRRVEDTRWIQKLYDCLRISVNHSEKKHGKKPALVTGLEALLGTVGGILLISAIICLLLFQKRPRIRTRARKTPPKEVEPCYDPFSQNSGAINVISLKEVYLATDNLSASNFIGQGVAGKVYKGVLSNGQRVAVKRIVNDGHIETFVREVTNLSRVKHPNLVELIGHCDGREESFLVYELCDNGNLSEWLFGKDKFLTWIQRLTIAIDCAKALCFLHTYLDGCIVHRDIKPTNILLRDGFQAKLSDFGLSKAINKELSYVSSEVRGTFGYVDPEYQKNHHVHSSSDVYSFGVVLLQLLSGQRIINLEVATPMTLSKMAKNVRKSGDILEFVDPKLNGEYSREAFLMILKLALCCTGPKQHRPSMDKVAAVLHKACRISEEDEFLTPSFQSA